MATLRQFSATGNSLSPLEKAGWEVAKVKLNPVAWAWYDEHKDLQVTKVLGFLTVRIGSFGIAEMVISSIFGPRSVDSAPVN